MITINSQLDMTPGAIPVVIHRSQYDSDFSIVFTLFARTGNFTIASGTTAKVRGTKRSGTGYSADATLDISAKTVTVTGDQQMTVVSGQNIFEIVLMSGTKELCSANFILNVERAALDVDTITDDTVARELDNLDQFVTEAEAAADRAETAAATFSVDATLTVSGKAADAKKTGDELAKKVDAVSGKGLSTNDYTDEEKTKLAGVETGANKTVIDTTLTQTGQAADAKAVGDAIANDDKKALAAFATDTASGSIASFPDGADSIPMKDVLVHIEPVQAGSGDPSPDNVRPITGWTAAKVTRTGKNLLPSYAIGRQKTENGITATANADGSITYVGTSTRTFYGLGDSPSILVKAGTYTLSARNNTDISINIVNAVTGSFIDRVTGSGSKVITFANDKKIYYLTTIASGKTIDTTATYQLELGSTATDYEPYHADTYDITFPSSAGTVYGGTLDVTSGVLTVDRKMLVADGSTIKFTFASSNNTVAEYKNAIFGFVSADALQSASATVVPDIISDTYKAISYNAAASKTAENYGLTVVDVGVAATARVRLAIPKSQNIITLAEANTWLESNPMQIVYPLATPITYQLTTQEITSLLGTNNLWADTGDTEVEYRADAKLYITKKITEAVSALS